MAYVELAMKKSSFFFHVMGSSRKNIKMGMKMQEMGIKNHKQRTSANVNFVALSLKINWIMDSCNERGEKNIEHNF